MKEWLAKLFGFLPIRPIYKRSLCQRPSLEPLEDRFCPVVVGNYWQPPGTNLLWSNDGNWQKGHKPTAGEQAIFDKNWPNGDKPVEADVTTTIDSILYQNGYSQVMTIDSGVKLETANGFDFSSGTANIDFKSTTSKLQADAGNSALKNFGFTDAQGTVYLAGGTLTVGNTLDSDTFSNFLIAGTLTVNNTAKAKFQSTAGLMISSGGQLNLQNTQITSLWSPATSGGILENWGTVSFVGSATSNPTEIDIAFLNHGSATFDTGKLIIKNQSTATSNYSAMMDGGTFTLKNGMDLTVDQGYRQTGGIFSVADAQWAYLRMSAGRVELDGGNIQLGTATTFGTLAVHGGDIRFDGAEYDAKIDGGSGNCDLFDTDKDIYIDGASKVVVTAVGAIVGHPSWSILWAASRTPIEGDFNSKTFPNGVTGGPDPFNEEYYTLDA